MKPLITKPSQVVRLGVRAGIKGAGLGSRNEEGFEGAGLGSRDEDEIMGAGLGSGDKVGFGKRTRLRI